MVGWIDVVDGTCCYKNDSIQVYEQCTSSVEEDTAGGTVPVTTGGHESLAFLHVPGNLYEFVMDNCNGSRYSCRCGP